MGGLYQQKGDIWFDNLDDWTLPHTRRLWIYIITILMVTSWVCHIKVHKYLLYMLPSRHKFVGWHTLKREKQTKPKHNEEKECRLCVLDKNSWSNPTSPSLWHSKYIVEISIKWPPFHPHLSISSPTFVPINPLQIGTKSSKM